METVIDLIKKHPLPAILGVATGVFLFIYFPLLQTTPPPQERFVTLEIGTATIRAEIADTALLRSQGLSGRDPLGKNEGMFFIFPRADYHTFWMKDMHFPIDIVWIGEDMHIVGITTNISPDTFPKSFAPPMPTQYVLETLPRTIGNEYIGEKVRVSR